MVATVRSISGPRGKIGPWAGTRLKKSSKALHKTALKEVKLLNKQDCVQCPERGANDLHMVHTTASLECRMVFTAVHYNEVHGIAVPQSANSQFLQD